MDWIKTWAMSLSMVIVFGTLTESILPGGNYRKYVHLVVGILLLVSVINPIFGLFNGDFSIKLLPEENSVYEVSREKLEYKQQKDVVDIYKRTIESNLINGLETKLPELKGRCTVRITADEASSNFGRITHAAVIIDELPPEVTEQQVRECAAELLGLAVRDVSVAV